MSDTGFWIIGTLFWTLVLSFYSMQEMASISCNKLRLDFAASQKIRSAMWLKELLEKPQLLFMTTLFGVTVAMMMSSECSRQLFETLGLDPNIAPLAEIPFLIIFGELIPMFAARLYPDHASRLGIPIIYATTKLLSPIFSALSYFFKKPYHTPHLSRDELQKLLEEHQAGYLGEEAEPENAFISNIFSLRSMRAFQLMKKLDQLLCLSTHTTVGQVRELVKKTKQPLFPVYHRAKHKIVGILYLQKILSLSSNKRIDEYVENSLFVPHDMPALELIHKLQNEGQTAAIVMSAKAEPKGLVFLDDLADELFGADTKKETSDMRYLEKTISADTTIEEFNTIYDAEIDPMGCKTFAELIEKSLARHPQVNDTLLFEPFEITVKETSLFKTKTIQIRSRSP